MNRTKVTLWIINILGGAAVLGSYVYGIQAHPGRGNDLWGGIPEGLRSVYTASMLLSAIGYLIFFFHIIRMNPQQVRLPGNRSYAFFHVPFLLILVPSAFWMSLTFSWLDNPATGTWIAVRTVLFAVAAGSVLMTFLLARLRKAAPDQFRWLSVFGAGWFSFHTLVLDGLLWPILFPQ